MPTLSSQELEKIDKALLVFVEELSDIKEVQSKDELKNNLLRVIKMEFEGISEEKLQEIYDLALEKEPSMQVLVSLESANMSSVRVLMREIRDIKTLLETEKQERMKCEQERMKCEQESKEWEKKANLLKITIEDLIYGICISDMIKHLPDRLAEFYKGNCHMFDIPKSLLSKSKEADIQWGILYSKKNLSKAKTDAEEFINEIDVESIKGTYPLLILEVLNAYCSKEGIVFSQVLIDALLIKKEINIDLHIKLNGTEKDAVDILNRLNNRALKFEATLLKNDEEKINTLNELWLIGKKLDLYNK
eukprot:NODE_421_length_8910_cov_0.283623.p3 type:complete len:305 gc:universal NODE_421_length_8910_cov_0.283623:1010-96(-)